MKIQLKLILFAVAIAFSSTVFAQKTDTLRLDESEVKHSPTKATIMSLALPGLGQAYNKKYWKIPLVYAAIGVPLYVALDQQSMFNEFKSANLLILDVPFRMVYAQHFPGDRVVRRRQNLVKTQQQMMDERAAEGGSGSDETKRCVNLRRR